MTPKNKAQPPDDESRGVLDDTASIDTTGIGILGNTAQVSVELPSDEDDALEDDGVVEGEIVADLIIDEPVPAAKAAAEISDAALGAPMVIELPPESRTVPEPDPAPDEDDVPEPDDEPTADVDAEPTADADAEPDTDVTTTTASDHDLEPEIETQSEAAAEVEPERESEPERASDVESEAEPEPEPVPASEPEPEPGPEPAPASEPTPASPPASAAPDAETQIDREAAAAASPPASSAATEAAAAAAFVAQAKADLETRPRTRAGVERSSRADKEAAAVETPKSSSSVRPATRASRAEVQLTSKRLDELSDTSRESSDLLTADRLLDPHRVAKPEPEGAWSHFLYTISGRRINIGDGRRARERKALTARIAAPLSGGARFIPVLSRKGGVGKTTITSLLGMALADAREDRVIAVDANPDRGTLADRVVRPNHNRSVRDLVRIHDEVRGYHDISAIVSRDATRLDVLASDSDPRIAEAFSDSDYRDVADVAAHYYSLVLTDTGTGIVHSVMSATLDLADQLVIVSGLSVDEARLASETLTWLETNGYAEQARDAVVVLNQSTPGAPLVRLTELETHFRTRAQHVVRMPYDPQIAGGGAIVFANLQPETRLAARQLAALLVEGLRTKGA